MNDEMIGAVIRQCIAELENRRGHTEAYPVTIHLLEALEAMRQLEKLAFR